MSAGPPEDPAPWRGGASPRVVFLDFDGVLNHPGTWMDPDRRARATSDPASLSTWPPADADLWIPTEPDCVERVNRLLARTGASVVISSSWRHVAPVPVLASALARAGLVAQVVGATPRQDSPQYALVHALLAQQQRPPTDLSRGAEIATWLRHCPGVWSFVVLDDQTDMDEVRRNFVQTNGSRGIQDADVERAIRILERPIDPSPPPPARRRATRARRE